MTRRDSAPTTPATFRDDDPFLLRMLPGGSGVMQDLRARVHRLTSNVSLIGFVLLVGETGTGKNHVARVIAGHRRWVAIKESKEELDPAQALPGDIAPLAAYTKRLGEKVLSELTETIAESQLFGHLRGAFTDARIDFPGLFGDDGYDDILLDEIGDAPLTIQAKLLAVLEGRAFIPVGGTSRNQRPLNKRILMATNRDLSRMVGDRAFRDDLFFRVRRHVIQVPPLRAHLSDLPDISASIIRRICLKDPRRGAAEPPSLTPTDLKWAMEQAWDGNVRELEEVLELWLTYRAGAPPSLQEVAADNRYGSVVLTKGPVPDIPALVRHRINDILAGKAKSPGTFSGLVKDFTGDVTAEVEAEIRQWYRERRPDPESTKILFPEMTWSSVKSVMARVGRR